MNVQPLPVFPWPLPPEQWNRVQEAIARAPFTIEAVPAHPGEPGRVLGMGQFPPFVCDLAYVADPDSQEQVNGWVEWMFRAPAGDKQGFGVEKYLGAILGGEVREVLDA